MRTLDNLEREYWEKMDHVKAVFHKIEFSEKIGRKKQSYTLKFDQMKKERETLRINSLSGFQRLRSLYLRNENRTSLLIKRDQNRYPLYMFQFSYRNKHFVGSRDTNSISWLQEE